MTYLSRRTIICWGHGLLTLLCFIMTILLYLNNEVGLLTTSIVYLVVFTVSTGPATFAFCGEILTDISLGIAMS
jgi:hypothetical protein